MNLRFSRDKGVIFDGVIHIAVCVCNFFHVCVMCETVIGGCRCTGSLAEDRIRQVLIPWGKVRRVMHC
jgi:hypothetical protein